MPTCSIRRTRCRFPDRTIAAALIALTLLAGCGSSEPEMAPDSKLPETRVRAADDMVMVYAPGGTFRMGRTGALQDRAHTVGLDSFWIDRTEVTNAQFRRCVEAGACRAPTTCNWGEPTYDDASKADHPVICVTWQAASDYCRWAGGRLPTEAEWEFAARGPQAVTYPWGDDFDGTRLNACDINCPHEDQRSTEYDDGYGLTAPVGTYPDGASWCGALDMAGNVWEWVADWHGPYPLTRQTNPVGPERGTERLIRGGSWCEDNAYGFLRADNRHPFDPRDYNHLIGLRCVVPGEDPWPPPTDTAPPAVAAQPTEAPSPSVTSAPEEGAALSPAGGAITGDGVDQLALIDTLTGHTDRVYGLDFSSDGRRLASGEPGWHDTGLGRRLLGADRRVGGRRRLGCVLRPR